jgi:predicted lipase
MKIHSGFKKAWVETRSTVMPHLLNATEEHPDYGVYFTGHSYGAGVASIAAANFQLISNHPRISLYSFGQARLGNRAFVFWMSSLPFADRVFRVVHRGDPIARLPPRGFHGYYHFGRLYQSYGKNTTACLMNTEDTGESDACIEPLYEINPVSHARYTSLILVTMAGSSIYGCVR